MSKSKVIIVIFILLGVILFLGSWSKNKDDYSSPQSNILNQEDNEQKESTPISTQGRYIEFSPEALETNKNKRRVLYFYANWCPTCKPADANLKAKENQIPDDLVIIRVNYNDPDTDRAEKDLANKYAVTYQHTFIQIDEEGKEITKWNGGQLDELLERIK